MIAPQTNSQSFKIRINFVSKIFWFNVHVFADKTTYNMFQRLPVGKEVGRCPILLSMHYVYVFFYPNTIDVWVGFSLSVHKENYFHHCKLKLMILIMMLDCGVLLHI